jgi:hypothetical protein
VSVFAIVLLVAAAALVAGAHWPRLSERTPRPRLPRARRARGKPRLRVVENSSDDDFVRAVERDLAALPTIDEQDAKKNR